MDGDLAEITFGSNATYASCKDQVKDRIYAAVVEYNRRNDRFPAAVGYGALRQVLRLDDMTNTKFRRAINSMTRDPGWNLRLYRQRLSGSHGLWPTVQLTLRAPDPDPSVVPIKS